MRVLKNDFVKYAHDEEAADDQEATDDQEETGWKYIHGDVFKYPKYKSLFAVALGSGSQLFALFRDELPDSTAQPKLLSLRRGKDRAAKYAITSLENMHKPQLHVEPDLGIPLGLLDLSVYNPPKHRSPHIAPEDDKLLQEDVSLTPIKKDGLKRKDRPEDKGMSCL